MQVRHHVFCESSGYDAFLGACNPVDARQQMMPPPKAAKPPEHYVILPSRQIIREDASFSLRSRRAVTSEMRCRCPLLCRDLFMFHRRSLAVIYRPKVTQCIRRLCRGLARTKARPGFAKAQRSLDFQVYRARNRLLIKYAVHLWVVRATFRPSAQDQCL